MSRPQWWVGVCDKDTTSQATGAVAAYRIARRVDRTGMPSTAGAFGHTKHPTMALPWWGVFLLMQVYQSSPGAFTANSGDMTSLPSHHTA